MSKNNDQGPAYSKPSRLPIIIAAVVVAVLVIGGGFAFYWVNRPINKVNKAIEADDIETVDEYFDKLSDDDKEDVEEQMLDYGKDLCKAYISGKKDYDEVSKEIDVLSRGVLKGNSDFDEMVKEVEELKKSRDNFEAANKAFDKEDYEKALDLYAKVIESDKNFETAQDKIKECESKISPDVVGKWECTIEIGPALLRQVGVTSDESDFKFPIVCTLEFKDDVTGSMYIDKEGFMENMDKFIDIAVESVLKMYKTEYGMSEKDIDKLFKSYYGMGFKEYLKSYVAEADLGDTFESMEFTYVIENDQIIATNTQGNVDKFDIKDDKLEMNDVDMDSYASISEMGVELPLVFEKVN